MEAIFGVLRVTSLCGLGSGKGGSSGFQGAPKLPEAFFIRDIKTRGKS